MENLPTIKEVMDYLYDGPNPRINMTSCMEALAHVDGNPSEWLMQSITRDKASNWFDIVCHGVYSRKYNSNMPDYSLGWLFKDKGFEYQGGPDPFRDFLFWAYGKDLDWWISADKDKDDVQYMFVLNQDEGEALVDTSFSILMMNVMNYLKPKYAS